MRQLLGIVLLLAPILAHADADADADDQREPEPQMHEVSVDIDISTQRQANGALFDARYTFTPEAIDRTDEVVPILRRFVRHPSSVWLRVERNGTTNEQVTGAYAGGVLQLFGGRLYAKADGGVELDTIDYDVNEHGYWAAHYTFEAGGRPVPLLSIGGFYTGRPLIGNVTFPDRVVQATRDGSEHRFGGIVNFATPNDRLWATLSGWATRIDYTFADFNPGPETARGYGASLRIAYQLTAAFSIQVRGTMRHEHWVDDRLNDNQPVFVGADVDRRIFGGTADLEIVYWFKGHVGFRFGLGGGYEQSPPVVRTVPRETGIARVGLGLVTRF